MSIRNSYRLNTEEQTKVFQKSLTGGVKSYSEVASGSSTTRNTASKISIAQVQLITTVRCLVLKVHFVRLTLISTVKRKVK